MKLIIQVPKPRSDAARALADRRYHKRVVGNKKNYSRKGRNASTRKFEDSIKLTAHYCGLIEQQRRSTMGNVHRGAGKIQLKTGVKREQVLEEIKKAHMSFLEFKFNGNVLSYEYKTKWPDYEVFEILRQYAAEPWENFERNEFDDWRAPARVWTYAPKV